MRLYVPESGERTEKNGTRQHTGPDQRTVIWNRMATRTERQFVNCRR